jgi:hypothetical protein
MRSRDPRQVIEALQLKQAGLTDRAVSEATGVPVNTIRIWRRNGPPRLVRWILEGAPLCATCQQPAHDFDGLPPASYAYLVGVYLGDGCLARAGGSWNLRISLDASYPGIVGECCSAVSALRGRQAGVCPSRRDGSVVSSNWISWPCLLPQHGPGRKHERKIEFLSWQRSSLIGRPGRCCAA